MHYKFGFNHQYSAYVLIDTCIASGVFYYPTFFEWGNNNLADVFVLELLGSCEMIPILILVCISTLLPKQYSKSGAHPQPAFGGL